MWRTDDMSLAAYLAMYVELAFSEWEGSSCFWYFEDTTRLADLVADYFGGKALVDPREHSVKVARIKREMFSGR